ncbi:Hypothetical Protein FCC1311_016162 [Hondaea fermentalgiana]|uniref:Uncharacterized protein n=1 Tax=Hondaea fermentalgiana TaxID=2315210 RepID=A0A2R5G6H9_9STRA|nr:Hypothetical Protein FCC1311_016162 [Hondaea fermentalgiana]|eukprot:GBG25398.1 Hypothetical Protein FCC1311_016162 [Hondaea fermentalgiana]
MQDGAKADPPRSSDDEDDEETPEYGLRRRNKDGKSVTSKKRELDPVLTFGKGWSIPTLPEKGDMRGLSKSQVKKDLKLIARTVEPDILEDMSVRCDGEESWATFVAQSSTRGSTSAEMNARSGIFPDDDLDVDEGDNEDGSEAGNAASANGASSTSKTSRATSGKGAQKGSGATKKGSTKRRSRPLADVRRAFTQTKRMGSTNFYYPFKKMKEWQELHDYLDFVNEQTYLSSRNAFVQKMAMLVKKREQQQDVLDTLHKVYAERLSSVLALDAGIRQTGPLLDAVLQHAMYYKERAELAQRELNASSSGTPKTSPRSRSRQRSKSNAMDLDEETNDGHAGGPDANSDAGNLTTVQKIEDLRCVHTPFGPGILHALRPDGFLIVKLDWGATVFMQATSLTRSSLDHLEQRDTCLRDSLEALLTEQSEPVPVNHRPVMYTRPAYGPPRGVPLHLSPLSNDPSFALPAATPMDPVALTRLYRSRNLLATPAIRDFAQEQEFEAADLDLRQRTRDEDLETIPISWGSVDTTPWAPSGAGIPRVTMDAWEADRVEMTRLRTEAIHLQRTLKQTLANLRTREKTVDEEHKVQARLKAQLDETRIQLAHALALANGNGNAKELLAASLEKTSAQGASSGSSQSKADVLPPRKRPRRQRSGSKADLADEMEAHNGESPVPSSNTSDANGSSVGGATVDGEVNVPARSTTRRRAQRVS